MNYENFTIAQIILFLEYLARQHSQVFLDCAAHAGILQTIDWKEIDAILRTGQFIPAIKAYREQTGKLLKEAKEACENRLEHIIEEEGGIYLSTPPFANGVLSTHFAVHVVRDKASAGILFMGTREMCEKLLRDA